jgi:hypothetical protein
MLKDGLLDAAVLMNAAWCEAVASAHGRPSRRTAAAWICDGPMPPYYPNAVTLVPGLDAAALPPGLGAVKDSFADLDLAVAGLAPLFEAVWIGRPAGPPPPTPPATVRAVADAAALARWAAAWGPEGAAIFVPALLADPRVTLLAAEAPDGAIVGGLAALGGAAAIGVSNAFGPPEAVAACVARLAGTGLPLVDYEPPDGVAARAALGFRPLGPLRVWARPTG